jgi:hypothetical protein
MAKESAILKVDKFIDQADITTRDQTMRNLHFKCLATLLALVVTGVFQDFQAVAADTRVEFELLTEPGFPLGAERRWIETLSELEAVSVRVRMARGGERPAAEETDGVIHVVGLLTSQNELRVPGGSFRTDDVRKLKDWLEKVRGEGPASLTTPTGSFGLTDKQLVQLHEALEEPISFSTLNLNPADFVERVSHRIHFPIESAKDAEEQMTEPILDELQGLSLGTSLVAVLRPCGLVLVPRRVQGSTVLTIVPGESVKEFWPLGWASEKSLREDMPSLLKFVSVGITDTPLDEAVSAIQQRLEAPILWDYNALAREGIEPHEVKVSVPAGRTYYKRIISKILSQAKLRSEVRLDEAGKAFLWITAGYERRE